MALINGQLGLPITPFVDFAVGVGKGEPTGAVMIRGRNIVPTSGLSPGVDED